MRVPFRSLSRLPLEKVVLVLDFTLHLSSAELLLSTAALRIGINDRTVSSQQSAGERPELHLYEFNTAKRLFVIQH
jgi:hypothetical protein